MAATRALTSLASAVAAAASATTNSTTLNMSTAYSTKITAQVTNSATAPTSPCVVTLQVSGDNTNWFFDQQQTAGLTTSAVYSFSFDTSAMFVRVQFSGCNQATTLSAQAQTLTAI